MSEEGSELRHRFLEAIRPDRRFSQLFDHLPDILFFAKDREGRLLAANAALLRRYGYTDEAAFWGVTDFELLPRSLAEKFRQDDLRIIETGEPMLKIVEVYVSEQGIPGWYLTNKLPVFDRAGKVIGVMGTIQSYDANSENLPATADIAPAVQHIGAHFHENLSVKNLAEHSGLSVRQFERKFREHLGSTPQQFIMKMRVYAACDDLRRTRKSIAEIATSLGFYDQASFTRQFKKHMGSTPLSYRRQFR